MRALVLTSVVAVLAAVSPWGTPAAAQGRAATDRPVDRIVAVVGTKPVLASQVEEQLVLAQSQGAKVPADSAGRDAARRQILSQMVDEELLGQQAGRDTRSKGTDREGRAAVEKTAQNGGKQFPSIPESQAQLRGAGFGSEEEGRRWLADQQRHSSSDTTPAARSCAWNSGIEVNCLRTFWTVCSTASCTSWSVTLIVVSRSACCTSSSSSTICERIWRRAASRPAESAGTFAPCDCARTSCSSTCDARIGFVPTTATMRSTGRSVAARPCAPAGVPQGETAASTATTMVRTRARMSARRLPAAALRRDRRRARRPLQTRGRGRARRRVRRPDPLCALQRPRDSRLVDRPRLVLAERASQEGRDWVERCGAPGHRLVHVAVDVRHGELHARGGGRGGVLEELGRDVQQALEPRDSRVVLGAQAPPVVRAEPHAGLVHLY